MNRSDESLSNRTMPEQPTPDQAMSVPTLAVASLEHLFHYRCGLDSCGLWWAIADIQPPALITCPHCSVEQKVPAVLDGKKQPWNGTV